MYIEVSLSKLDVGIFHRRLSTDYKSREWTFLVVIHSVKCHETIWSIRERVHISICIINKHG